MLRQPALARLFGVLASVRTAPVAAVLLPKCIKDPFHSEARRPYCDLGALPPITMKYLNQSEAAAVDEELFTEYQFSVDQLMELAGQGCAHAVASIYPSGSHPKVLVVCGPGNNGGDGLVCARHLTLMGYTVALHCAKRTDRPLYNALYTQCYKTGVEMLDEMPDLQDINRLYHVVVDAVFGFSFKPPVRPAMLPTLRAMAETIVPVVSIDIPSGWDVNTGPPLEGAESPVLLPRALVSLTAPKLCAKHFTGEHHVLAGRFVPPVLAEKYGLELPEYPGLALTVLLLPSGE